MDIGSIKGAFGQERLAASIGQSAEANAMPAFPAQSAPAAQRATEQAAEASRTQVEGAVTSIQEFVQSAHRNINFAVDDSSGRIVVKVTDVESGEVIRQIPSEDALRLAENVSEIRSLLFKAEA